MKPSKISKSDGVVFLLGAGASASHGLPVMSQFLSAARRRLFDHHRDDPTFAKAAEPFSALLQFHHECRSSAWLFNRDWDNIEELYTQADLCRIAKVPDVGISRKLCESIAWAIWDIYRVDNETGNDFAKLANAVRRAELAPKFITTNYDVVIERALGNHPDANERSHFYYPGFDRPKHLLSGEFIRWDEKLGIGQRDPASSDDDVPIIKLHGSVNWFTANPRCYAFYDSGLWRLPNSTAAHASTISKVNLDKESLIKQLIESPTFQDGSSKTITPCIVPPMLGKSSDDIVISYQWNSAINVLRRARQVWIIGYSFPPTDTFMPRLLAEGLYQNTDLDFIAIANIEDSAQFDSRLRSIFNPLTLGSKLHYLQVDCNRLVHELRMESGWESRALERAYTASKNWRRGISV